MNGWCTTDVSLCRRLLVGALAVVLWAPVVTAAASLQELAQRLFPQATVDAVEPTPIPNLYEVRSGKTIVYMDAGGRYVFVGELYDFTARKNLTAQTLLTLNAVKFADLPLDKAIRLGPATAAKRLALFEDVDCPYCRKFHAEVLPTLFREGVGVYVFLLPLPSLHPQAERKSTIVWCSANREAALAAALQDTLPLTGQETGCATPLADIAALASHLGIHGTPTIILDTGLRLDGFLASDALLARWQSSARR